MKKTIQRLKTFLILWSTQSLSQLGSAMTSFALGLWVYSKTGSALQMSLLSICTYAPYILVSIFAGALSDRWDKKKVMLVCDTCAAATTLTVLILIQTDLMHPAYLCLLNAVNGLMNTIQQPASDVAVTLITTKEDYQRTSGLSSFSQSLITILHPIIATTLFSAGGMNLVISVDLISFVIAFFALLLFVYIPKVTSKKEQEESFFASVKAGLVYLKQTPMILSLILFMAGVNLSASAFDAILPAYVIPRSNGGNSVLSIVTSCAGIATLAGSMITTILPKPKNRIRLIYITMLFSLSVEQFLLAFSRAPFLWCLAQFLGWSVVPIMSASMNVILRSTIPVEMQGRVYSCRNTLQYFTIPIGLYLGGLMVDHVCEPIMAWPSLPGFLHILFGSGKGSGAGMMMFFLGVFGTLICVISGSRLKRYHFEE